MTLVSLVMIGGNYFFPWTGVHEILGASLFVLWGVHIALNGPLVRHDFERRISSVPHYANGGKLRHPRMRNIFDDKRHYAFAAPLCIFGNRLRFKLCTHSASACKPLVLFVYVAAHRTARRNDCPADSGKAQAAVSRAAKGRWRYSTIGAI